MSQGSRAASLQALFESIDLTEHNSGRNCQRDGKDSSKSSEVRLHWMILFRLLNRTSTMGTALKLELCINTLPRLMARFRTYQYEGVVFKLISAGVWKGDSSVKQKLEFFATRKR